MTGTGPLHVRDAARSDILDILDALRARADIQVCVQFRDGLKRAFAFVAEHPTAGIKAKALRTGGESVRCWRVPGFPNHFVFYTIHAHGIDVVRVLHGARDLPRLLAPPRRRRRRRS